MVEAAARRATREHLLIAIGAAIALARILAVSGPQGANDRSRWATVVALVEHGTYAIGERVASGRGPLDLGLFESPLLSSVDIVLHPGRQRFYSSKPTLLPTVVAAEYLLLRRLLGWQLQRDTKKVVLVVLLTFNWLPLVFYLLLLRRLLVRTCSDPWTRTYLMACACFATFVTSFVVTLNNHTIATHAVLISLYLMATSDAAQPRQSWRLLLAGLCAGWAASAELPATAFCFGLLLLAARRAPRPTLGAAVPAAILPMGAQALTTWLAIGTVKPAYAHRPWYRYPGSYWLRRVGVDRKKRSRLLYALHFLVGHHGLLSLSPMFVLALLSALGVGRRSQRLDQAAPAPDSRVGLALLSALLAVTTIAFGRLRRLRVAWFTALPLAAAAFVALLWRADSAASERRWQRAAFGRLTLACSVASISFYVSSTQTFGGIAVGPRWLMWLVPLWILAMVPTVERWAQRRSGRAAALLLAALSAISASTSPLDPWQHPWLYRLWISGR